MAGKSKANAIQDAFKRSGLTGVFVEELGWETPREATLSIALDDLELRPSLAASLKNFRVYEVPCAERPSRQVMRAVGQQLAIHSPEHMEVFQAPEAWSWHWPRRNSNGTTTFESVDTAPGTLPLFLAQRLTGLEFTASDYKRGVTLADVRDRVHGKFDASPVTRRFYERFADEQSRLADSIEGLAAEDKYAYSTTLLNRLMFIYFMQKKQFLNNDPSYLENTLASVRALRGQDHFYAFYKDALLPLFFDKLDSREGDTEDPDIHRILGDVPYVNGGIFGRTDLEVSHGTELLVPDSAFERILEFFGEFNWHLDTRPTGNPNEINPEVIGYIFEQFINVASSGKKENGAYYTPHDVTAYMVAQTLVPRILDELQEFNLTLALIKADCDRYIQPAMLHGWDAERATWLEAPQDLVERWIADPSGWGALDEATVDPDICLPGETWVEAFHRRQRVEELRADIRAGRVRQPNDLVTRNLNSQLLLTDTIDALDDGVAVRRLFEQVTQLAVFDPTCGSGAFLFAALEVLEDVYDHLIDEARTLSDQEAVRDILELVEAQPSKRYFVRKHTAIQNLYGTDLMPGAIETAKLRIFLALAACVDSRDELKPLPDLDFNLKTGNLVVGFKDSSDVERIGADLFTAAQLSALQPKIDEHSALYADFTAAVEADSVGISELKARLRANEEELRNECDVLYAEQSRVTPEEFDAWKQVSRPFHWFCEFPGVMARGGFDVIIGNPPYVRKGDIPGYAVVGYRTTGTPDLYAPCYERSLSLLAPTGRHAFIVMSSLAFGERFAALRAVIADRQGAEWWSTYGKIPSPLFRGVKVRNTILILGPGDGVRTTRHHIHTAAQRDWLFPTIEYANSSRQSNAWPVRGGVATRALELMQSSPLVAGPPSGKIVYLRRSASYWFPALLGAAPVLDADWEVAQEVDKVLQQVPLVDGEALQDVQAFLGGKLTYLWWSSTGDDFNVNPREADVPRAVAMKAKSEPEWASLVAKTITAARSVTYVSLNRQWYFNVRWNNIRDVTDRMDALALEAIGGSGEDWRALNVLYRQVMRSSGDSAKGRYVTKDEMDKFLGW